MAKLVHKFQFASHNRSLKDIKTYYDRVLDSLEYQYSREHNADYDVIFANKSEAEVAAELDRLKEELSMEGAFELLAYLEKVFRTDCHIRCTRLYKDDLSKSFKDVYKSVVKIQYKIGFIDVIVAGWKKKIWNRTHTIRTFLICSVRLTTFSISGTGWLMGAIGIIHIAGGNIILMLYGLWLMK